MLKQKVFPTPYNACLIAATVTFALPRTTSDDILEALADCAEVKQVLPIFLKEFPSIKSAKFRVMLKPQGEGPPEEVLPSYITLYERRASLFYAGRIPRSPYCNSATHLGRGPQKGPKKSVFTVTSLVIFALNVLTSSNLTTMKILRAEKPALTITEKTTTSPPSLKIHNQLKIERNYLPLQQHLIIQPRKATIVLKILIPLVLLHQHMTNLLNARVPALL